MGQIVRVNKPGDKNHGKTVEVQGFLLWRTPPTYSVRIDGCYYEYPVSHLEHVDESNALPNEEVPK